MIALLHLRIVTYSKRSFGMKCAVLCTAAAVLCTAAAVLCTAAAVLCTAAAVLCTAAAVLCTAAAMARAIKSHVGYRQMSELRKTSAHSFRLPFYNIRKFWSYETGILSIF